MGSALINLAYLAAATLFILGIKGLTHPRTAVRGNQLGAIGMLIAVVTALVDQQVVNYVWIIAGLVIGSGIGALMATRVQMTDMPQMVALLNGFGGIASTLVAGAALLDALQIDVTLVTIQFAIATAASGLIGTVTFWGSMVAFGKLQGIIKDVRLSGAQIINAILLVIALALSVWLVVDPTATWIYWAIVLVSTLLGLSLVFPIGGADMPVVISLLNSYSGIAASAAGFVLNNNALIITGSLVGASGIILTSIMCRAMNRSLTNVLFGIWVAGEEAQSSDEVYGGRVKAANAEELAMLMETARRVVIVPGYGMAVSQAQHAVRDLVNLLEERGAEVEFAIHPVAGRMPGHMNVLLAEADIPYDKMKEMDEINPSFEQTDVVIVIGANDVVNPVARTNPSSPIAGMPILNVDKARSIIVIKRSLSPGFAGIPNPLFAADNTLMLFADAKKGALDIMNALKAV
ncbi:NAD(P)(+) transhydrogenase (Re/Si-specific) subunit beta [Candidatus Chloroploca sp. M-50]|uniref:NAD(P) transhydrogenase subunit beta n=1 Tax=Candidatus Chloroploca mongolica TaxID=2528176 RepID=A0ABS4DDP0_9CHLR|nr:NAD(P)(+) transhydrogenase (Re/Si-specific) subunit beta [Candidatus Chloroploca mongolica]MBP1467547.1 NAD(P)(+) transhydrogenase (Re/Si-specific) subunit beta [Candidatus Chloroploca mongolica]